MRRTWVTVPTTGLLAGLLLLGPAGGTDAHAHSPSADAVTSHPQAVAADTGADTTEATADATAVSARDTTDRDLGSVVKVSAGLSTVTGAVLSDISSQPVSSAVVTIERLQKPRGDGFRSETDDHGRFRFQGIPSGDYLVTTHHIGYRDRQDTISVGHRALVSMDVPLVTEAVELPPIRVEVQSAWLAQTGFYWRKERGLGRFLTPDEVSNRNAHNFAELMRGVQGVEVVRACGGGYPCDRILRMRQTNTQRACRVQYFMDGQPLTGRVYPTDISAHDIAAVEIYRNISETPAEFYGRCGSVVLWSKRFDPSARNR